MVHFLMDILHEYANIGPGLGAFCAPFSATQFAQLDRWSFHFMISLGISLSNVAFLATVFGFKSQDGVLFDHSQFILDLMCC